MMVPPSVFELIIACLPDMCQSEDCLVSKTISMSGPQTASDLLPQQIIFISVPVGDLISSLFLSFFFCFISLIWLI